MFVFVPAETFNSATLPSDLSAIHSWYTAVTQPSRD